jgi:hypothetical protein
VNPPVWRLLEIHGELSHGFVVFTNFLGQTRHLTELGDEENRTVVSPMTISLLGT